MFPLVNTYYNVNKTKIKQQTTNYNNKLKKNVISDIEPTNITNITAQQANCGIGPVKQYIYISL